MIRAVVSRPMRRIRSTRKPASGQKVPLQLKISQELRREFKAYAVERDAEVSTLFAQVWTFYKEHHG